MYVTRTYQQLQFNSIIKIVQYFGYIFDETEKDIDYSYRYIFNYNKITYK